MIEVRNSSGCVYLAEKSILDQESSDNNPPFCKLDGTKLRVSNHGFVVPNNECPFTRVQYGCNDYSLKPASIAFRELNRPANRVVLTDAKGMQIL